MYTTLGYEVPMPEMGETSTLAQVVERTEKMADAMVLLVTDNFVSC